MYSLTTFLMGALGYSLVLKDEFYKKLEDEYRQDIFFISPFEVNYEITMDCLQKVNNAGI